jgi:hypothetical protein
LEMFAMLSSFVHGWRAILLRFLPSGVLTHLELLKLLSS